MATYQFQDSSGRPRVINLPEGVTIEDVLGMATPDPMQGISMGERFMMGVGKAARDTGTGIGQVARGMMPDMMADEMGLPTRESVSAMEEEDAPLMDTGAGMLGNVLGNIALVALPGGAAAKYGSKIPAVGRSIASFGKLITSPRGPLQSALGGAILGATKPVGKEGSRAGNAALGGLKGATLPTLVKAMSRAQPPANLKYDAQFLRQLNAPVMSPMMGGRGEGLLSGVPPQMQRDLFRSLPVAGEHAPMGARPMRPLFNKFSMDSPLVQEELQRMAAQAETRRLIDGLLDFQLLPAVKTSDVLGVKR